MCEGLGHFYLNVCFPEENAASYALERKQEIERSSVCVLLLKSTVTRYNNFIPNLTKILPCSKDCALITFFFFIKNEQFLPLFMHGCSSVVEDCEEAFVKNPDGHPLVLYLRTDKDHALTGATRQLLERVNAADKAAKIEVCVLHRLKSKGKTGYSGEGDILTKYQRLDKRFNVHQ